MHTYMYTHELYLYICSVNMFICIFTDILLCIFTYICKYVLFCYVSFERSDSILRRYSAGRLSSFLSGWAKLTANMLFQ